MNSIFRKVGTYLIGLSDNQPSPKSEVLTKPDRRFMGQAKRIISNRARNDGKILAGSIQFLDLEQIEQELGVNWATVSTSAYKIVEQTISRKLSPDDTYVKHGAGMFVLCFASANRDMVEARMRDIVEEIKQGLSRTKNEAFRVSHDVADVVLLDTPEDSILETIASSLRQVRNEAESAAKIWREHLLRNAAVHYKPVWSPQKKIVAIHRAVLDEETGQRTVQRLSALSSADEMLAVLFDLDCLILGRAASGLHDLVGNGGRTQLIVPVNFNSMNVGSRRKRYLKLCEDIPPAYQRFLLFEIRNIPSGTPGGRILDLAVSLNANAHGTLIETSLASAADLVGSAGSAIMGAAVHADQLLGPGTGEITDRLKRFVTEVRSRNLRAFLHGANTPSLVQIALAAGIDYMDGASIANLTRELKTLYPWKVG